MLSFYLPLTKYPYHGSRAACPVCRCEQGSKICGLDRRWKRLPTYACDHCGLLFTNPMPREDELANYYTHLYRWDYQGAVDGPKQRHLRKRLVEARHRASQLSRLLGERSRTLDFGCGTGEFIGQLLSGGHDAHGFEPGKTYGDYARSEHGERVQIRTWQDADYDGKFDAVTCFHVLEHLRDPIAALRQMARWTHPDGYVYVEVPNMGEATSVKGFGGFHFAHVLGFNHHNLLLAASQVGLQPKVIVADTAIIFEHGEGVCRDREARCGRELARELYGDSKAFKNYFRYQTSKLLPAVTNRRVSKANRRNAA